MYVCVCLYTLFTHTYTLQYNYQLSQIFMEPQSLFAVYYRILLPKSEHLRAFWMQVYKGKHYIEMSNMLYILLHTFLKLIQL